MNTNQDVFCVFEGGGAKGVAHVGFLTALDSHKSYIVRGYAGTSAGAIVAALAAAGWKGEELFSEADGVRKSVAIEHLNTKCGERISALSDFIEPNEWRVLSALRRFLKPANESKNFNKSRDIGNRIRRILLWYLVALLILLLFTAFSFSIFDSSLPLILLGLAIFAFSLPACLLLGYFSGKYTGFASMARPERLLEALLQHKIPNPASGKVTFKDIEDRADLVLKVIASDLENGGIKLFSAELTPEVSVAKAVSASACIPLIFKPVAIEIDGEIRQFCDGGLVSNLPAWAFDSERLTDTNCLTVTCEISPPERKNITRPELKGLRLLVRIAITSIFGSSGLNTRGIVRHIPLSAWAEFKMLDFDLVDEQANLIQTSKELADIKMDLERSHRMSIDGMFAAVQKYGVEVGLSESTIRIAYVRNVELVDGPPSAYHLWNCRGFEGYADTGITLPTNGSLLGHAIASGEYKAYNLQDPKIKEWYDSVGNGSLKERLAKDRAWVTIVPITDIRKHTHVSVAVCIDSGEMPEIDFETFSSSINEIVIQYA